MVKKKYKLNKVILKNKKIYILIAIIIMVILSIIIITNYNRNKLINEIKSHYSNKVKVTKDTKLYSKDKKVIGTVKKGYTFNLNYKNIDSTDDTYFNIKDTDYYIYYDSIEKTKKVKKNNINQNYLIFNSNIEGKNIKFYIDNKIALSINKKVSLPIIYMDSKYYYVYYLNRLLQVKKDNIKVVDKENTKENESSYISVINYNKIYDKNNSSCKEKDCIDISFVKETLKYLKDNSYYTITLDEYNKWLNGEIRLKPNAILLTTNSNLYNDELNKEYNLLIQDISNSNIKFNDNNSKNTKENKDGINRYNVKNNSTIDDFKKMTLGETIVEKTISGVSNSTNTLSKKRGIAVLNYHFFYDSKIGESCNENICLETDAFRRQLDYLKDNGYKTLTIDEFSKWMYNEISLPEKSVLITIDDGAMGTSRINGNKLIPILEEYKMNATLFLITAWWDKSNYESKYLDVESHGNDIHITGDCGKNKIHCLNKEQLLNDFTISKQKLGTNTAFCYPFYSYNNTAIEAIKETGFKIAFAGGSRKALQSDNKYLIPRYPIHKDTSFEKFIEMVS